MKTILIKKTSPIFLVRRMMVMMIPMITKVERSPNDVTVIIKISSFSFPWIPFTCMFMSLSKLVLNPDATITVRHTSATVNIINSNDLSFTIHCGQTRASGIEHVVGVFILIVYSKGSPSKLGFHGTRQSRSLKNKICWVSDLLVTTRHSDYRFFFLVSKRVVIWFYNTVLIHTSFVLELASCFRISIGIILHHTHFEHFQRE